MIEPCFQGTFVFSFCLVVRELDFIVPRFFIMCITRVATLQTFELAHEYEVAAGWNMKDFT